MRNMNTAPLTPPYARLELALWQAESARVSNDDLYLRFREMRLPPEVAIRLKSLLEATRKIGGTVISIGKIIAIKLIDFVKSHPHLAAGVALGAALSSLIASVPLFGMLLAPIAVPLGIISGAIGGHRIDRANGERVHRDVGVIAIAQDLIEMAKEFFALFIATLAAIAAELKP